MMTEGSVINGRGYVKIHVNFRRLKWELVKLRVLDCDRNECVFKILCQGLWEFNLVEKM